MKCSISEVRTLEGVSSSRLRRARRLYKRMVTPLIHEHKELALIFAFRGIKRGLWAESTGMKDVTFNLIRAAYKSHATGCDWWEYKQGDKSRFLWYEAKQYFTKTENGWVQDKKVRLRLTNAN